MFVEALEAIPMVFMAVCLVYVPPCLNRDGVGRGTLEGDPLVGGGEGKAEHLGHVGSGAPCLSQHPAVWTR